MNYFLRCAAINRTLENGIALTDPKFYREITKSQLNEYLMGDSSVPCPMIEERVKCLHGKKDPNYLLPISIYNKKFQKNKGPIIYFIKGRSPSRHEWRFYI